MPGIKNLHWVCIFSALALGACSSDNTRTGHPRPDGGLNYADGGTGQDSGVTPYPDGGYVPMTDGGYIVQDPKTCDEAAMNKSYIGCDYWPTVVANPVWNVFDYAVVVSNPGDMPADVTVTGPNSTNQMVTVMPGQLQKIYLQWEKNLKGNDFNSSGAYDMPQTASVLEAKGAYHLVSTMPVLVYQFSALEYGPTGGPPNKDWSMCPGTGKGQAPPCFSYSNDASLLLPSTAMTGNYRVVTEHGVDGFAGLPPIIPAVSGIRGYIAITATQDATTVKVQVSSTGQITAGTGVTATAAGGTLQLTLNAGDVAELLAADAAASDLSGSLVQADKPVQVIGGIACIANPSNACDHIEETVLPEETWGKRYAVAMPTGPHATAVGATLRFVGNVDGTTLTYDPPTSGMPTALNAGQTVEIDASNDFVVTGNHEFAVSVVQKSGSVVDPNFASTAAGMPEGDPSLSGMVALEQYRLKYVFLAPTDYDFNFADVVAPMSAHLMLDGAAVSATPTAIGGSGFGVYRIALTAGANAGAHTLEADQPVGLQVLGYGLNTSYQYPGGLDLVSIAPPPPPIM